MTKPVGIKNRPIFHVGIHKTATSWFQKKFYPNVEGYRFIGRRLVRETLLARSPFDFDPVSARKRLGLDRQPASIVCEEDLSGVLHNGLLSNYVAKEIASQLAMIAPDAEIVLFVRSQIPLAASFYQQYVREGGTANVRRYLFPEDNLHLGNVRPLKLPAFDFSQFEFDRLVALYDSLFGRENVHVFAFEEFAQHQRSFLKGFCAQLGISTSSDVRLTRVNMSYQRALIPAARLLNLFTRRAVAQKTVLLHIPFWYPIRKELLEILNRVPIFGGTPNAEKLLGREIATWIQKRFAESNAALAARMRVDLEALGYPVKAPHVQ